VNHDDVTRLHAGGPGVLVVVVRRAHVVRAHQPGERRFLLLPLPVDRVHVIGLPARGRLRLLPRAHGHVFRRLALHAVGIRQREPAFVFRVWIEIEHAAREHVGDDVVEREPRQQRVVRRERRTAVDPFVLKAQQRQTLLPDGLALLSVRDVDLRVAVVVAHDFPVEAQRQERRRLDRELTRGGRRLRLRARGNQHEQRRQRQAGPDLSNHVLTMLFVGTPSGAIDTPDAGSRNEARCAGQIPCSTHCNTCRGDHPW
jgi:hypothetical protein